MSLIHDAINLQFVPSLESLLLLLLAAKALCKYHKSMMPQIASQMKKGKGKIDGVGKVSGVAPKKNVQMEKGKGKINGVGKVSGVGMGDSTSSSSRNIPESHHQVQDTTKINSYFINPLSNGFLGWRARRAASSSWE